VLGSGIWPRKRDGLQAEERLYKVLATEYHFGREKDMVNVSVPTRKYVERGKG